jgi:GT2 family glycosyltransferase
MNIVFVDGSPSKDYELETKLDALGVEYLHFDKELSFAQTYNAGIRRGSSPVVVTLANDILVEAKQVRQLADEIRGKVGCAFPYMSCSDYGGQKQRKLLVPRRCFPSRMTINVNAFSREALEMVGLIPECMSGCFNDVVLFIRLREEGWSIVLRNVGQVFHIGQQTLKTLCSSVSYEADEAIFAGNYPQYWRKGVILFHKTAQRWTTRAMYGMIEWLPARSVRRLNLWRWAWAIEPYLCAERGTVLEGVGRIFRVPIRRVL